MSYHYSLFGFTIQSELRLFGLSETAQAENSQVKIEYTTDVPKELKVEKILLGVNYANSDNEFLFELPKVARYYVSNGTRIQITPLCEASEKEIVFFLMNPVFIILLYQRGFLPFHACAVEKKGKAFLISGAVASGISSLTAGLLIQGFNLLADDLCVLTEKEGQFFVEPYFNGVSLWRDVVQHLNIDVTKPSGIWTASESIREGFERFSLSVDANKFMSKAIPLSCFFQVSTTRLKQEDASITALQDKAAFSTLLNQLYFSHLIHSTQQKKQSFHFITQLAQNIEIKHFKLVHSPLNLLQKTGVLSNAINQLL